MVLFGGKSFVKAFICHIERRKQNSKRKTIFEEMRLISIRSRSLAIFASTLDSLLDPLSGSILWFTALSMQTPNPYQYPIGKRRMQALGILVFGSVMATFGLQIMYLSVLSLISDEGEFRLTKEQETWVVIIQLLLAVNCCSFTHEIVKAYAQDHLFDFITNVIGLVAAILANYIEG